MSHTSGTRHSPGEKVVAFLGYPGSYAISDFLCEDEQAPWLCHHHAARAPVHCAYRPLSTYSMMKANTKIRGNPLLGQPAC